MSSSIQRVLSPLRKFFAFEASSSLILGICVVVAMAIANSPWADSYFKLLHSSWAGLSVLHWVNDGLMVIFFFMVGMEIKREIVVGELRSIKRSLLPVAGALGGVVVPALIYRLFNPDYPNVRGWGIPMATDIAFAVGVLSLFGRRVPAALKVLLLALAIVDDLCAVLVIALFYTQEISSFYLVASMIGLVAMVAMRGARVRHYSPYVVLGVLIWYCVLRSGVHATFSGVLIGLLTPLSVTSISSNGTEHSMRPLDDLVGFLHGYVAYLIMPVFALANGGVSLAGADLAAILDHPIFKGIAFGLIVGKPVGVLTACWIVVRLGFAELPKGIDWKMMTGLGFLAGIGFTMALFISSLALYPEQEIYSKVGILSGSLVSALLGVLFVYLGVLRKSRTSFERRRA